MKHIGSLFGIFGLVAASTTIATADDSNRSTMLFTPRLSGDHFVCSAVNVSAKTLGVAFAVLGDDGTPLVPLAGSDANPKPEVAVSPGAEAEIDLMFPSGIPPTDGYCAVAVSGTRNHDAVRVDLQVYWTKPIIPGTTTPIIQLARTVQGY